MLIVSLIRNLLTVTNLNLNYLQRHVAIVFIFVKDAIFFIFVKDAIF